MITQCPACQTMFRVVPDQLRLSEGWVRCGQCEQVFDANVQVVPEPPAADAVDAPPPAPAFAPPPFPAPEAQDVPPPLMREEPVHADALAETEDDLPPVDIQLDVDIPPPPREPLLVRAAEASAWEDDPQPPVPADDLVVDPPAVSSPAEVGLDALSIEPEAAAPLQPQLDTQATPLAEPQDSGIALPPVAPPAPTFMHKPMPSTSVWHRTGVRVALGLLSLLLLLLGGQVVLQERDRIAALQPTLKPVLNAACQLVLGCSVSAFKQIDGIVIDSSSFTRLRGDAYRLSLVVKNTTTTELAAPAIELTLTDSQDKPVLRRVLPSRDFDIPVSTVAAGADWTASLAVSVKTNGGERISGYRVLAFYP